ncbi:hypothetical protein ACLB1G_06980 [Oxalobacteraceae bacterium A2-2]
MMNRVAKHSREEVAPVILVTEELPETRLLRCLLDGTPLQKARYFAGQQRLAVTTLARNILLQEGIPVMVVLDANDDDPVELEQLQLRLLSTPAFGVPYSTFVFIPSLRAVAQEVAAATPQHHEALSSLLNNPGVRTLPHELVVSLRQHPQIRAFMNKILRAYSPVEPRWDFETAS